MATRRTFLKSSAGTVASLLASEAALNAFAPPAGEGARPNIILLLADDMGYSDIGCFGSEISTPNLDALAAKGVRMSQCYNNPRCCPSRASILTGLYSHQVGFGLMADDYGRYPYPQYSGDLSPHCVTIPEALKTSGYSTAMVGKWHLTPPKIQKVGKHNWPLQRGFDRYYGNISGAASYFNPVTLTRDNDPIPVPDDPNFYYTDALAENAAKFVEDFGKQSKPFFLYCSFTAPHWPLHAPEELIKKYEDRYLEGWDQLRANRHQKQIKSGLLRSEWKTTERDFRVPAWVDAEDKKWEARRMAVYAAMIERMDQGIGHVLQKVKESGKEENTLIVFMSDNGGNAEEMGSQRPNANRPIFMPYKTRDGSREVQAGNNPQIMPGPEDTYQSIGIPWGNCANTPFRLYKHYAHEGGISTPFIAAWPKVIRPGKTNHAVGHETDLMPTFLAAAGASYPRTNDSGPVPAMVGESLLPVFRGEGRNRKPIYWEHEGNKAVRDGKWKLVSRFPDQWELYDMEADRTELHDISAKEQAKVAEMTGMYQKWAEEIGVQAWPMKETPNRDGGKMPTPPYLHHDSSK